MKSTVFRKIVNEEFIEVDKSVPETIECLRSQSGRVSELESERIGIYLECSKKGKIRVYYSFVRYYWRNQSRLKPYSVYGRVVSKDGKTYIKVTSVFNKVNTIIRMLDFPLTIILLPLVFLKDIRLWLQIPINYLIIAVTICLAILGFNMAEYYKVAAKEKKLGTKIVTLLENEIKRRVENIKRWDE